MMKIPRFNRFSKILLGVLIFIVILLFSAPRAGRWYIVRHGREIIGRSVAIDRIRVNYFTGTLTVRDFKLFEDDDKSVFASFRKLRVNLEYFPLLRHEIAVKYINLDEPFVEVLQNGNSFNFSDLIKSDTSQTIKDSVISAPTRYRIDDIRISRGYVKYTDLVLNHTIALDSLDLQIPGFTWNSGSTKLDVNFNFVDGGGLYSKLALNQADSTYTLNLRLDSLNLGIIEPYLRNYLNISGIRGYLSNDLVIKGSLQSILRLDVSGDNSVYGFALQDTIGRTVLSAGILTARIDTFLLEKNHIRLNKIGISNPYVLFELVDSTSNLSAIVKETSTEKADTAPMPDTTAGAEFTYNVPPVVITGGRILFSDKTLGYPFEYNIDNLTFNCNEDQKMPGKIDFKVSAGLNGTGTFQSEGIINPGNFNDLDLSLKIEQFRMKDADAYFKHFFGFPVTGGIMNFSTENRLRPESLESANAVYFRRFTLGQRLQGKSEYKVPLRLAISILSDKDGIIDLKAPVKMKGENIKVINLGRIVFKIIGNLFVKAATAPFNLLSGLYNASPASLQEIRLNPDQESPDPGNLKSLDIIADFLNKKPLLTCNFIYCLNRQKVADTLAYLNVVRNYIRDNKESARYSIPDTTLIRYLKSKTGTGQPQADTTLQALLIKFAGSEVLNHTIDSLARLQVSYMRTYLEKEKGLPPERFKVIEITPDSIMPNVKFPYFRIYFNSAE